MEITNKKDL